MNTVSRTLSGIGALVIGIFVIYLAVVEDGDSWSLLWGGVWGLFFCGIGVYLFLNKKEDVIEEINDNKD